MSKTLRDLLTFCFMSDVSKERSDLAFGDGRTEARIGVGCGNEGVVRVKPFTCTTISCLAYYRVKEFWCHRFFKRNGVSASTATATATATTALARAFTTAVATVVLCLTTVTPFAAAEVRGTPAVLGGHWFGNG